MTAAPKSTTAVVIAFHRPAETKLLLGQLDAEVDQVVLVNVEDDPRVARLVEGLADAVHVPMANLGYAAAVNEGSRQATGDVVCFMNDDLSVLPGTIERLVQAVVAGATVALPSIVDGSERREPSLLALPTPWLLLLEWALTPDHRPRWAPAFIRLEKWRDPDAPAVVQAGTAALVAVDAAQLRDHPLPEDYFMYWEELEWFWDLRVAGLEVVYVPAAVVQHHGGSDDVRPEKSELLARNAVRCVRRTQGSGAAALAWPVVVLWWTRLWLTAQVRSLRGGSPAVISARRAGLRAAIAAWREIR